VLHHVVLLLRPHDDLVAVLAAALLERQEQFGEEAQGHDDGAVGGQVAEAALDEGGAHVAVRGGQKAGERALRALGEALAQLPDAVVLQKVPEQSAAGAAHAL